jgi:GT2 family glycosyltransferase
MQPKRFTTSVHLVTYNGMRWLPFCLEALERQTSHDFFLLVIDNGSLDASADFVERYLHTHPDLARRSRVVRNKLNLGFSRAHNQALAWTESDYVLMLNQDVLLAPDYLENVVRAMSSDARIASVTGKLLKWKFDAATFYLDALQSLQAESQIDSAGLVVRRSRRVVDIGQGEPDTGQYVQGRLVFGTSGAAPLYRREALQYVSPLGDIFDENFISYKEDVDLAWRLQLAGYDAWYESQAVAYHDRGVAGGVGVRAMLKHRHGRPRDLKVYSYVNHLGVLIKNDSFLNHLLDAPWFLGHELVKFGYLLFTDPITLARAWGRLFALLPKFLKQRNALTVTHRRAPAELRKWWTKM